MSFKYNIFLVTLILLLYIKSSTSLCQDTPYKNFTEDNELPSSLVYGFRSDKEGFVWLMTDKGLARYNGKSFDIYNVRNGLSDNDIFNFYIDSKNRKWPISHSTKIGYLNKNNTFINVSETENSDYFIYENNDSFLCIYNSFSEYFLNDTALLKVNTQYKIESCLNSKNKVIVKDSIYYLLNDLGVSKKLFPQKDILNLTNYTTNSPQVFFNTEKKLIYIISNDYKIDSNLLNVPYYENSSISYSNTLNSLIITSNKHTYIINLNGTRDLHLERITNKIIEDPIKILCFKDKKENIWVTDLKNGVYYIPNYATSVMYMLNTSSLDKSINIKGTFKLKNDNYVYSLHEIYKINQNNNNLSLIYKTNNDINDVFILNNKSIGIITYYSLDIINPSIKSKKNNKIINIRDTSISYYENYSFGIEGGKKASYLNESFFLPQYNNVLKISPQKDFIELSNENNGKGRINSYYKINSDKKLIISRNGIYLSDKNKLHDINTSNISPNLFSDIIYYDNTILLTTKGFGLFEFSEKESKIKRINSFKDKFITKTTQYKENLWLLTDEGIYIGKREKNSFFFKLVFPNELDVIGEKIKDFALNTNSISIATKNKIIEFNFNFLTKNYTSKEVFIRTVTSDSTIQAKDSNLYIVNNKVSIILDALTINNKDFMYEYQLEGIDRNWESTSNKTIHYNNLPYGTFKFKVRLNSNLGRSLTKTIYLKIPIPFWKSFLGKLIIFIFIFFLVSFTTFFLVRNYYSKKQKAKESQYKYSLLQFKALQNRMNPHFIFNALDSFQGALFKEDRKTANTFLIHFSSLLRKFIDYSDRSFIKLIEEIKLIEDYLQVEQIKHINKFEYEIILFKEVEVEKLSIPTFLLQPITENAIEHGIRPLKDKKGKVTIQLYYQNNSLIIDIIDNGNGFKKQENKNEKSRAMKIINDKITLINKNEQHKITFEIKSNSNLGTIAKFTIPLSICLKPLS